MPLIESGLALAALLIAFIRPSFASRWFALLERKFSAFARRPALSVVVVGLLALALRLALIPIEKVPEPIVHDEFGYLLAADTFAHGRLTNATHPMWVHFETFSIIQKPTYQCFAQPAQGLVLAAGKLVFGHPFYGVCLSIGIMCAAITWALQGWMPSRWAVLAGLLAMLRLATFSYWANSYWGGAVGAIGGSLILGALPRLKRSRRVRDALVMGVGLALLAANRPSEGFFFSLPFAGALFAWMFGKNRPPLQLCLRRVIIPLCLVVGITAIAIGYYCLRVTGNPFRMPYQVERQTYAVVPYMLWQSTSPPPSYHHELVRRMYASQVDIYIQERSLLGGILVPLSRAFWVYSFYIGPILILPLVLVMFIARHDLWPTRLSYRIRVLLLACGFVLLGLSLETFYSPHYASPITSVILGLVVLAMRRLQRWHWPHKSSGLFLTRAIAAVCVVMFVLRVSAEPLGIPVDKYFMPAWYQSGPNSFGRAAMLSQLQQLPGRQLVLVRYQPGHDPFEEWVYNDADIDAAKVVWARDMSPAENEPLISYFGDRHIWLLEADQHPPALLPYSIAEGASASGKLCCRPDANGNITKR
jgi:hypothetical protein